MKKRIDLSNALSRRYSMWRPRRGTKEIRTINSTLPYEVVEREARKVDLVVEEFIQQYDAEYLYDSFDGLHVRFVKKEAEQELTVTS